MQLLAPVVPNPAAPLARANPVAKLGAGLLILLALFASLDGVTALIIGAGLLAVLPASGLSPRVLLSRAWLVAAVALSIGVFNILFAAQQLGSPVVSVGPVSIGARTIADGVGLALRLLAVALAGLLATATSDPSEMADALVAQLRVSPRFAVGVLAALRLLPILAREWQIIGLARRARGIDAGRSPVAAAGLFGGRLMALLVAAIRRGTRMAMAMEARGFGTRPCRTLARTPHMRTSDWLWIAGAALLSAAAIGVSVALGTWRPLVG
jgi:energy-coupling factor transport system permease protein